MGVASKITSEQRRDIVLALISGKKTMAELCREYQTSGTSIAHWRDQFIEAGTRGFEGKRSTSRERSLEEESEKLRKIIGDQAVALHLLKGGDVVSRGKRGGGGR